jgi:hypothetical protein
MTMKKIVFIMSFIICFSAYSQETDTVLYSNNECVEPISDSDLQSISIQLKDDTLTITGKITANCCGTHFLKYELFEDLVYLSRLDTGNLCDCYCLHEINIKIGGCTSSFYTIKLDEYSGNDGLDTLLFSMNNLYSQGYQKLVATGNRWNYLIDMPVPLGAGSDSKLTNSFFLTNDTVINNTNYMKLMCDVILYYDIQPETDYVGALREDTISQQVFFLNPANEERLVYSFDHAIGDTILIDSLRFSYAVRYVKSIDSVDLGGIQRKRMEICEMSYTYKEVTPNNVLNDLWIEGVGSLKQLIYEYLGYPADTLLCFWHNDEMIYDNPAYDSCVYASKIDDIVRIQSPEGLLLYPNPVSGLLHISCSEPVRKIELLDMEGNLLQTTSTNELDVSGLIEGIYFIKATTESARVLIERFIRHAP